MAKRAKKKPPRKKAKKKTATEETLDRRKRAMKAMRAWAREKPSGI